MESCLDRPQAVLEHEWPEKSGLWGETVFKGVSKKLVLEHGCLVDRCCFEKGKDRPWKRWWFVSNSSGFIWDLSSSQCDGWIAPTPQATLGSFRTLPSSAR